MYCGIDVGTTNTKVLVFDDDFKVVFLKKFKTPVISSKEGDLCHQKTFCGDSEFSQINSREHKR